MTTPLDAALEIVETIGTTPAQYVHKTASEELSKLRNDLHICSNNLLESQKTIIELVERCQKLKADLEDARLDAEYRDD